MFCQKTNKSSSVGRDTRYKRNGIALDCQTVLAGVAAEDLGALFATNDAADWIDFVRVGRPGPVWSYTTNQLSNGTMKLCDVWTNHRTLTSLVLWTVTKSERSLLHPLLPRGCRNKQYRGP